MLRLLRRLEIFVAAAGALVAGVATAQAAPDVLDQNAALRASQAVLGQAPGNHRLTTADGRDVSLFHYRNQGADYGRVLVGMEVPANEMDEFRRFLDALGYPWVEETSNAAYRLFLG